MRNIGENMSQELEDKIKDIGYSAALKEVRGDVVKQNYVVKSFVKNELKEGIYDDYGPIPGFGDKPTLLKPGAEKLCALFDVIIQKEITHREIDVNRVMTIKSKYGEKTANGFVAVEAKCILIDRLSGSIQAIGVGAASNEEPKQFKNLGEAYNSVVKFAGKRAEVDAALGLSLVSDMFTQDIEDMEKEDKKPAAKKATTDNGSDSEDEDDDEFVITYGSHAGKTFDDPSVPDNSVQWYGKNAKTAIAEGKFVKPNTLLLEAAQKAAAKRGIKI